MSRVIMCGWETGSPQQSDAYAGATVSNVQARTGTYSLRIDAASEYASYSVGAAGKDEVFIRLAVYPTGDGTHPTMDVMLQVFDSTGVNHLTFAVDNVANLLKCFLGNTTGALLDSCPAPAFNAWTCYEVRILIANAPNGIVQVKEEGVLTDLDFTGDTQNAGVADVYTVRLGSETVNTDAFLEAYYDDLAVNTTDGAANNTWIGRGGIQGLVPSGAGTTTQWTPSAGNNWDCVDEQPPSDADYVGSSTLNQIDTYAATNLVGTGTIDATCDWMRGQLDAPGAGNVARMFRIGGVDYAGSDLPLAAGSWAYVKQIDEVSPDTGIAWVLAEVNAAEIGEKVR